MSARLNLHLLRSTSRLSQLRSQITTRTMATSLPKTMKGILIEKPGGVEVLQYKTDLPVPTPKEGEVLIKNDFIGINYIDTYLSPHSNPPHTLSLTQTPTAITAQASIPPPSPRSSAAKQKAPSSPPAPATRLTSKSVTASSGSAPPPTPNTHARPPRRHTPFHQASSPESRPRRSCKA